MVDAIIPPDINEQLVLRQEKLQNLREQGQAFPNQFKRSHLAATVQADYATQDSEALSVAPQVFMAGRMMTRRLMGKASFIKLQDMSGQIQVYLKSDGLAEGLYTRFKQWDIGDIVGVSGALFKTKTGELSVRADNIELLTKALRPLPDKFHGLNNQETRYRQRYLDLIANPSTRKIFDIRGKLIHGIRQYLLQDHFVEVETPMMQAIPGGAAARPFETFHNALEIPMFLRIAPELYLKRLVVGGIERVFEINRNFRNEGISTRHNPEFTMLEFYQAYADYHDLMNLTEALLRQLATDLLGTQVFYYQDIELDFAKPFLRLTMLEAIQQYNPQLSAQDLLDIQSLRTFCEQQKIPIEPAYGLGKIQLEIFEKTVEEHLHQPTFITHYPAEVSPLARACDEDPFFTDRFEFFIAGREIANGFSELNDPQEQASRFKAQVAALHAGDTEAMPYDEDYIHALEYGLPPTAGEGIGIDRLVMIFTNSASIREVILFPLLRPKDSNS